MKTIFLIAFCLMATISFGQNWPIDKETGRIVFTEVVSIDSSSKNELYLRAREWFSKTYNDSKEVIQMDDKEAGKIVGKALFKVYVHSFGLKEYGYVNYNITIVVKDGRYKYELTDLYHEYVASGGAGSLENEKPACGNFLLPNKYYTEIKQQSFDKCTAIIEALKKYMKEANSSKKENW